MQPSLQRSFNWIGRWSVAQAVEGGGCGTESALSLRVEQEQREHQPGLFYQSKKSVITWVTSLEPWINSTRWCLTCCCSPVTCVVPGPWLQLNKCLWLWSVENERTEGIRCTSGDCLWQVVLQSSSIGPHTCPVVSTSPEAANRESRSFQKNEEKNANSQGLKS